MLDFIAAISRNKYTIIISASKSHRTTHFLSKYTYLGSGNTTNVRYWNGVNFTTISTDTNRIKFTGQFTLPYSLNWWEQARTQKEMCMCWTTICSSTWVCADLCVFCVFTSKKNEYKQGDYSQIKSSNNLKMCVLLHNVSVKWRMPSPTWHFTLVQNMILIMNILSY